MAMGWIKKSRLLPKIYMTIAITSASLCAYKMWLGPYVRKQRYKEAEAWSAMIIANEDKESYRE